jgi:uncharacterized protein (DUF2141 family)
MRTVALGFLTALAAVSTAAADDSTATLTVTVLGVSDAGGQLKIGLYDEAGFKSANTVPLAGKSVLARPGKTTVRIEGIAPGSYGVKMFQDVNRNGHFDFGMRTIEPFGVSNDPQLTTALPSFDDAKITLVPGDNPITITLR